MVNLIRRFSTSRIIIFNLNYLIWNGFNINSSKTVDEPIFYPLKYQKSTTSRIHIIRFLSPILKQAAKDWILDTQFILIPFIFVFSLSLPVSLAISSSMIHHHFIPQYKNSSSSSRSSSFALSFQSQHQHWQMKILKKNSRQQQRLKLSTSP